MAMPSKVDVIRTGTFGPNAPLDTGVIDTAEYDTVAYWITISGGPAPAGVTFAVYNYANRTGTQAGLTKGGTVTTGALQFGGTLGPGCTDLVSGGVAFPGPVGGSIRVTCNSMGVGVSMSYVVYGRRAHRGPDVSSNPD